MLQLAALGALAACSATVTIYKPFNADELTGHTVLMMSAVPQPSVPEDALQATLDAVESGLGQSPYIGKVTTRAQFRESAANDFGLLNDYRNYADLASNVGMVDQEAAWRLAEFTHTDLLASVQVYQVTCPMCPNGDATVLMGQMVDAAKGDLVWRATLRLNGSSARDLPTELPALHQELLDLYERAFKPRWQRVRFRNLARLPSL